ncbi:MAG: DNA polymerase III subunit beta [Clostridia bacterium]|nr:DNA polymerase III subunit beta [Clostridia bacterium]
MKIICSRQALVDAVNNVQRGVASKSALPALEGILMKASASSLFLAGYDMELGITTTIEATVEEAGELVLTAKLFSEIVRKLPEEEVSIISNASNNTVIRSGNSEFTIMGFSSLDYPELPTIKDGAALTMQQSTLKSMIRQTLFAASQDIARPVHTGVLFEMDDSILKLVAVDGSRLAMRSEPVKSSESLHFVVPGKTLSEVLKLLNDEEEPLYLTVGSRHMIMEIGGYSVFSRLLDGEFLPYKKAIPADFSSTIRVKTRELIDAVDRASLVINDRLKSPLICRFKDNQIFLSCITALGSVNEIVNVEMEGRQEEIGFNCRFLLDALRNTECDEVVIELNGAHAPMKLLPATGDSFLFLVLPVKIKRV